MIDLNSELLEVLISDEKNCNTELYTAGPYWKDKCKKAYRELKQKGLDNFRGYNSGVGTSYCDNIVTNLWNEEVSRINNILTFLFSKIPIFKRVGALFNSTQNMIINLHKEKLSFQEKFLSHNALLKELLNKYKAQGTTSFGCVDLVNINSNIYSTHYLEKLNSLSCISKIIDLKKVYSMFEIGGGFGANTHLTLQNYKNVKKVVYLDIVPNLFVGTEYLRSIYGDSIRDYLETRDLKEITFSNDDSLEIICIAPWQIEKLKCCIDYFHNAHSFVEMPEDVIRNYAFHVERLLDSNGRIALISYDKFSEETTVNPEKILPLFKRNLKKKRFCALLDSDRQNFLFTG